MSLSKASEARVKTFVDWFVRSEYMQTWHESAVSADFGLDGRFGRCMDAAEHGADGNTHAEVIQDWRAAFSAWVRDKRLWTHPERFTSAVEAHFDRVEAWHEQNGSLYQEIG